MVVRVVDAWNYGAASEIDLFRLWTSKSPDLVRIAGGNNAFTANGKRLHVWMRDIAGKDFAVEQNQVGGLRVLNRDCRERQEGKSDGKSD